MKTLSFFSRDLGRGFQVSFVLAMFECKSSGHPVNLTIFSFISLLGRSSHPTLLRRGIWEQG